MRVGVEGREQRVEIFRRRTGVGDKLERLPQGLIGGEAVNQNLGDLPARNDGDGSRSAIDQVNEPCESLERADVRYQFVIEMASLAAPVVAD